MTDAEKAAHAREVLATKLREFCGFISGDIPELHRVEVPRIGESVERFLKASEPAPPRTVTVDGWTCDHAPHAGDYVCSHQDGRSYATGRNTLPTLLLDRCWELEQRVREVEGAGLGVTATAAPKSDSGETPVTPAPTPPAAEPRRCVVGYSKRSGKPDFVVNASLDSNPDYDFIPVVEAAAYEAAKQQLADARLTAKYESDVARQATDALAALKARIAVTEEHANWLSRIAALNRSQGYEILRALNEGEG